VIAHLAQYWHSATWTRRIERLPLFHGSPFLSGAGEHLPFPAPVIVQQEWTEVLNCFQNTGRRECCAVLIVTHECAPDG